MHAVCRTLAPHLNEWKPSMIPERARILSDDGITYLRDLESTRAMRKRLRELAVPHRDDFDRAVIAVLDDLEGILVTAPRS